MPGADETSGEVCLRSLLRELSGRSCLESRHSLRKDLGRFPVLERVGS